MLLRHLVEYPATPGLHSSLPEGAAACCLMQCCIDHRHPLAVIETVLNTATEVKLILYLGAAIYTLYLPTRLTSGQWNTVICVVFGSLWLMSPFIGIIKGDIRSLSWPCFSFICAVSTDLIYWSCFINKLQTKRAKGDIGWVRELQNT